MQNRPHVFTKNKRVFESLPDFGKSLQMVKIVQDLPDKVDQRNKEGAALIKMCYNNTPARTIIQTVKNLHQKNPKLMNEIMHCDLLNLIINF